MDLKWCTKLDANFDPNWGFPDCNFSLNMPMALKCCTKLNAVLKRCTIIFQGHPSNFKFMRDKKSQIFTRIEHFRTVTPVWIHQWIWNDAQSLMWYRRGALSFFEVIHQIWRSHSLINRWFWSNLSKIIWPVAAIKSLRFSLWWYCLKKWQIAIKCDGKSLMTDNHLNMKEILKLLIFDYIISDYSWSYGDHSISTLIYLFI